MAYRFARSPQRERIWQVNIQFSRFRKGKRHGSFLRDHDQDNRRCHTAEKVPFTIHDIFRRFINGVKAFVYKLFTFDALMGWKFKIWHERNLHSLISDGTWNYETLCCVDTWPFALQIYNINEIIIRAYIECYFGIFNKDVFGDCKGTHWHSSG